MKKSRPDHLIHLFLTFLKIGSISFGGFMALVSAVQKQVVERDKLISNEDVLDGISLASVLPGPLAVNVIAFIGYKLRGIKGALVSISGVLLPSFILMLGLSFLYFRYGNMPELGRFFAGVLPAVSAIIVTVAVGMIKKNISDWKQILIVVAAACVTYFSKSYVSTLLLIAISALAGYLLYPPKPGVRAEPVTIDPAGTTIKHAAGSTSAKIKPINQSTEPTSAKKKPHWLTRSLIIGGSFVMLLFLIISILPYFIQETDSPFWEHRKIMLTFSGMSLSLFGGGYVAVPSMQKIIVETLHWLTNKEFVDAIALGQVTPGPILISATFIGYRVTGFLGALNATLSIFLPTAILMIICTRFFNLIKDSAILKAAFKGLRPAIIGMILSAAFTILMSAGVSYKTIILFLVIAAIVLKYNPDPVYIIPVAGVLGLIFF